MMEAGWPARRIAHKLGRSDCVEMRCWDQWVQEMSFTRRSRQTSSRENHHIVRNARVQSTTLSTAIQAPVAPSLGAPVSSRAIKRHLAEGLLPLMPTHRRLRSE
ncbi:transposable element Tcb2 transposase [Trichonephila clavipes]|uniref:Transposable element Tcb2 transposase n=1 Tax=Trichonephila clavipes TaxID=2585209 RepID=A0A8X6W1G8_TRICX|nr:transposable element Tcb2 transposase [Trichonephila clavipes]